MSDTRRDELRERLLDYFSDGAPSYQLSNKSVQGYARAKVDEVMPIIQSEVLAVLERLSVIANSKMYPNGIEDDIEQEKQNYAKQ